MSNIVLYLRGVPTDRWQAITSFIRSFSRTERRRFYGDSKSTSNIIDFNRNFGYTKIHKKIIALSSN